MKTKKEKLEQLLATWKTQKQRLCKELKPEHIRLLRQRIVKEKTFREIAMRFEMTTASAVLLLDWILNRIKKRVDIYLAAEIEEYNAIILAKEAKQRK